MPKGLPAAGGGRSVEVAPERVVRWLAGFADRHGGLEAALDRPDLVRFVAADGASAECQVPFPPLRWSRRDGCSPAEESERLAAVLAEHAARDRRVGVLLVRLGGFAAGVCDGADLVASKVGSRHVHGRSAAGGQSQGRFARRRDNQSKRALRAAADVAATVLVPYTGGTGDLARRHRPLEAVVCGGDRRAIQALREDRRLAALFALETGPFLTVPDPRLVVLKDAPRRFRAVRVRIVEP